MELKERIFHIISNTHWDREWRFPFQLNRQMLVETLDKVIEILTTESRYRAFHLDSQTIVLEDYLEIKPHKKDILSQLVKDKKLFIGPWYVLPDEFQVGGENLIRNLLIGHRIANEMGRVSKVGYSPFSWGQISQLPQIYTEFGIDFIMFYRGVNSLDAPKAEFIWEGADGTQVLASRFSTMPRYNFYFYIYRPVVFNEFPTDIEFDWKREGMLFHFVDESLYKEDYFNVKPADTYYFQNIKTQVEKIIQDQVNDFTTPHVIWMEGHDSSGPNIKTVQIIEDIKKIFPELTIIHSTLEDYSEDVKKSIKRNELPVVKGERRSSQYDLRSGNLYGYTTSARMDLKLLNFDAERWLQYYAEPFYNFSALLGNDTNDNYLNLAWKLLVQNSSHDSIGGCSLDAVHNDMINRYKQVIEISKGIFSKSLKFILSNGEIKTKANVKENYLTVFNPTLYLRNEVIPLFIDMPVEFDIGSIKMIDLTNGENIPVQISSNEYYEPVLEQMIDRPMYFKVNRYKLYAYLKDVPSFGYKTFLILPEKNSSEKSKQKIAKKKNDKLILENEFITLEINQNGTLKIKDKINNYTYDKLAYFYDEGEGGHAWINNPFKPFINSLSEKARIKLIENGTLLARAQIDIALKIPKRKIKILSDREITTNNGKIPIRLIATIQKFSPRVDLEIHVNNTIENHRLRIMFPTKINAKYHFAEGQFDVVERKIERIDAQNWVEKPMYDFPLHHFVDISDGEKGLAIIVDGLKEYEVLDNTSRTIALTLLRSFSYVIIPSSVEEYLEMKGSQCLGKHIFRLALYPHRGFWKDGKVFNEAMKFNYPLSAIETSNLVKNFSVTNSFLKVLPEDICFSAFKKSEDGEGYILRVYNPSSECIKTKIEFFKNINLAYQVTLEEKIMQELEVQDDKIEIEIKPKKIVNFKLKFDSCEMN